MRRLLFVLALGAAAVGCGPREINYAVSIITTSCDPAQNPVDGARFLRVRVTGDGLTKPLEAISAFDATSHTVTIPEIPSGKNRVVEVRAYDGEPGSGGTVISMGRTLPFDIPDVPEASNTAEQANVFLRRVNAFTPPVSAAAPSQCERMAVPRAAHTATLLADGRVFIAGGYRFVNASTMQRVAGKEAELYDPQDGTFSAVQDMSISNGTVPLPKAFHTATLLPNGQVIMWGGETYQSSNSPTPSAIVLVYDPGDGRYFALKARTDPPPIARTRHAAALDKNGKLLIVGGLNRPAGQLQPVPEIEWYDPSTNDYHVVQGAQLAREGMSVTAVKGGDFIAVAGGTDGTNLKNDVSFFSFDGTSFGLQALANPPRLADPGRRLAAVATLNDGADMLLVGGYADPTAPKPTDTTEIVSTSNATVAEGPTVGSRAEGCAVNLADGSVLVIGGRTTDDGQGGTVAPHSDATTMVITSSGQGGTSALGGPSLPVGRYEQTCTLLEDGTVLVLGGVSEDTAGNQEILQDALIYQPAPND